MKRLSGRSNVGFPIRQLVIVTSLAVCGLVAMSFARLAISEYQLNLQKQVLVESVNRLKVENQSLQAKIDYLQTDAAIEKLAREELGWTKPGDTAVIVLTSHPIPTLTKLARPAIPTRMLPIWRQWWNMFFASPSSSP